MNKKGLGAECHKYGARSYIYRLQYQARHSSNLLAQEGRRFGKEETLQGLMQGFLITQCYQTGPPGEGCVGCGPPSSNQ